MKVRKSSPCFHIAGNCGNFWEFLYLKNSYFVILCKTENVWQNLFFKIFFTKWRKICRLQVHIQSEDDKHLLLVSTNTQKVKEHFCLVVPFTHTSIFAELMQTTNTLAKFVAKFAACYQYQRTICPPWFTFHLMDSLIQNGRKIVNNK
jgi:hypothetical protein